MNALPRRLSNRHLIEGQEESERMTEREDEHDPDENESQSVFVFLHVGGLFGRVHRPATLSKGQKDPAVANGQNDQGQSRRDD